MTVKSLLSHAVVKPVVAGVVAGLADHLIMKNADLKACAMFGGAVGAGIFATAWVEPLATKLFPTKTLVGSAGKALEGRIVEIACASASAYALNRFVLKNEINPNNLMMKLGIVIGADLAGETLSQIIIHL